MKQIRRGPRQVIGTGTGQRILSAVLAAIAINGIAAIPVWGQDDPTLARTRSGEVRGLRVDDVVTFKGIPYAAPPVGSLRWREPQPVAPWTDVRDATAFHNDCMQLPTDFEPIATEPAEDCLCVNVWRPAGATSGAALPVLFWIHGGGFVGGGSSIPIYDGSAFARQGIVVVSLNYRLGRLGFFAHPALLAAREGPVGNYGYLDQVAALHWVQENVAAFGGDPRKVTIAGESAGGASVLTLLTSPAGKDLFQQAVILSGGGRKPLVTRPMIGGAATAPSADQIDARFADSLGIQGNGSDALAALRAVPASQLIRGIDLSAVLDAGLGCALAELEDPKGHEPCAPTYSGTPVIDGRIVTGTPEEILPRGNPQNVPVLIGTTAIDMAEFFPPTVTDPYSYFGNDAKAARSHYQLPFYRRTVLGLIGKGEASDVLPVMAIGADMTMHEPARFVARQMTARGIPAWLYRFTYTAESARSKSKQQTHAGELPFLFQALEAKYGEAVTDRDRATARAFSTYVANFVKTGDPNGGDLPRWPRFDPTGFNLMNFTLGDGPVFGEDPRARGIALVERAAETPVE